MLKVMRYEVKNFTNGKHQDIHINGSSDGAHWTLEQLLKGMECTPH